VTAVTKRLQDFVASDNIADDLDDDELSRISSLVLDEYEIDERSNAEWTETAKEALAAALQIPEAKNTPFAGAANVKYPLVTVAALQFNARAYPAIVDGDQIVKAKVVGSDDGVSEVDPATGQPVIQPGPDGQPGPVWKLEPGAKRAKADRVSKHMSYQLTEEMEEWEEDTDTLLMQLPIVGTAFRKVYYDAALGRNMSEMVAGTDIIVHRSTRSLETVPRLTHRIRRYPHEIQERQLAGLWVKDFEPGAAGGEGQGDEDAPHEFLEQHRYLDLDKDGYREPYIVTVHKDSGEVVRIVANYGLDDIVMGATKVTRIKRRDYFVKYGFIPDPKGGFYDIGFGQLLRSIGAAIDTTINQMLDAGHLQNAGGGFIGSGVRLKKGFITAEIGRYMTVEASGSAIRDAIVPHNFPGPSAVLFNLLGLMIDAAKDITAVQDIMTGDGKDANQTATTTLALIEQGMKVFTAIYKRIYRSLKQEFKLLFRLNAEHLPEESYFNVMDTPAAVRREDYDEASYDVCPQADPRLVTDMQRLARAQLLQPFIGDPMVDQMELRRRMFAAQGQEDIDKLLPPPQPNPIAEAAAEAEVRGMNATAEKDETAAVLNIAKAEAEAAGTQMQAAGMLRDAAESDRAAETGERRAAEGRADKAADREAAAKAPARA
jgi:chaperonin GroES